MRFKDLLINCLFAAVVGVASTTVAQTISTPEASTSVSGSIIEKIESESEGKITFDIPSDILEQLLTVPAPTTQKVERKKGPVLQKGINKIKGFRVQVFSDGRNQSTLEARVKSRANAISAKFPKYRGQVYTFSSSPNWYCRVGNFQTKEDATRAMNELKRAFPGFAGEMRVVNSEVIIIK